MTTTPRGGSRLDAPLLRRATHCYAALPSITQLRVLHHWIAWQNCETADALAMFALRPDAYHAVCDRFLDFILGTRA